MQDQINWVDMPVIDLDRAAAFYSAVLNNKVEIQSFENFKFGLLPHAQTNVSGCLVPSTADKISTIGALIYFNVNGRLTDALMRVTENGGEVIEDKTALDPHRFKAIILDSEGNRIALHSREDT